MKISNLSPTWRCHQHDDVTNIEPLLCIDFTRWVYVEYYFAQFEFNFTNIVEKLQVGCPDSTTW